jgi:RNA polymerase sigma-70 factor (ECF subfamily)
MTESDAAVERVYGEHAARILAVLVRIFGTRNLELAEDVLQEAFRKALVAWQADGVPENPAAWIMAAAKNQALDVIRGQRTQRRFSEDLANHLESGWTRAYTVDQEFQETRIKDDQLRMIFMCTGADLPPENRIPLILRTVCGLGIPAICRALFLPEATVKKRLLRTRERLQGHTFEFPPAERLPHAICLPFAHSVTLPPEPGFGASDSNSIFAFTSPVGMGSLETCL